MEYLNLKPGGLWGPDGCKPRYKVALIVPFRNRENNLKIFLRHLHPFLSNQLIEYGIYLIEPVKNLTFNRGILMNIGFIESLKTTSDKWDCFMFHDVDLIPEEDRNIYSCPETPRHMSSAVSKFKYKYLTFKISRPTNFGIKIIFFKIALQGYIWRCELVNQRTNEKSKWIFKFILRMGRFANKMSYLNLEDIFNFIFVF